MPAAFAVIHTWPELRNAEYEVIQRLLAAAKNVGRPVALIDNTGNVVWANPEMNLVPGHQLPRDAVEFVISLHFESPRMLDIYSYYAIWQPINFYFDFGYERTTASFSTHNDLLSCDSDMADAHAMNLYEGLGREPMLPLPRLFHMVAEPYLPPKIGVDSKLFYIGINWERIGRPQGRFHDTLVSLDSKGLTTIYGPERIMGVAPWEGFSTYEGELPFDGHSVKRAINRAGICLALSSAQHKQNGIMSNRLFEGLAGGAAVIATPNPLIDKHFRDVVYLVDDSRGEDALGQMVLEALREIRSDPAEAQRRVLEGQRILRDVCSLELSIETLFAGHETRKSHFDARVLAHADVTVILIDHLGSADLIRKRLTEYREQQQSSIDLHILCERGVAGELVADSASGSIRHLTIHSRDFRPQADVLDGITSAPERTGPIVREILQNITTSLFVIAGPDEQVFSDHLASLARALVDAPKAQVACSGALRDAFSGPTARTRSLLELKWPPSNTDAILTGPSHRARYMYRSALAENAADDLLVLLDGEEHRYFLLAALLAAPAAQTAYATYVLDEGIALLTRPSAMPAEFQRQAIKDRLAAHPKWLEIGGSASQSSAPETMPVLTPWDASIVHETITIGRMMETTWGKEGTSCLRTGFSQPEHEHTWLAAKRGVITFALPLTDLLEEYDVVILALGRRSLITGREQHCTILINGMTCAYLAVPQAINELRVRIPRDFLASAPTMRLELIPDHLEPADPEHGDDRNLAIALYAFGVMPQGGVSLATLRPNVMHGCGKGEAGNDVLLRGFYEAEADLTWMAGTNATIRFRLARPVKRPVLRLGIWGRRSEDGALQTARIALNKQRLKDQELPDRSDVIDIQLGAAAPIGAQYNLEIRLAHAEVTKDENGRLLDGRLLGLAFMGIGVFEDDDAKPQEVLKDAVDNDFEDQTD